jgi:hypothetical protein
MDAQVLVPLYLTILMVVLAAMAIIGGSSTDKKTAGDKKDSKDA